MITVRRADANDLAAFCALWNEIWPSLATDVEEQDREDRTLPEEMRDVRWLAELDGAPVGFANAYRPAGHFHVGKWMIQVGVPPSLRNRGIGTLLYEAAQAHVEGIALVHISSRVREDDPPSVAFAEKRGFKELNRDFESQLDLRLVSVCDLEGWRRRPQGIRIVSLAELDSPAFRVAFHELFEVLRRDIPRPEPPVRLTFEFFVEQVLEEPNFLWEGSFVAMDGDEFIGYSAIYRGANEGWIDQWMTAVLREYRGRGIALALKAATTLWAHEAGFTTVRTDNNSENAVMLAINDRMGFKRSAAILTVRTTKRTASDDSR